MKKTVVSSKKIAFDKEKSRLREKRRNISKDKS